MASVKLRKRKNSDGTTSLYLDIYTAYTDNAGNKIKRRKYEFLNECKQLKANTPLDRMENKTRLGLAEQIRNKYEADVITRKHDLKTHDKQEVYFKDFCNDFLTGYNKLNKKNVRATIAHFFTYLDTKTTLSSIFCRELTVKHCEQFLNHLEENFNGETIESYFRLFKKIVKAAYKEGFLNSDVAADVICKKGEPQKKDILDFEEISLLANTHCPNQEVRRAFLFACYTGLRWVDLKALKWSNIQNGRIKLIQAKTKHAIDNNLHQVAVKLLGMPQNLNDLVFNLPSHAGSTKTLKKWCFNAGILKNITWHCARHSFGTNIIYHGETDVNTASKLLGHKTLEYTQRYVHEVESLKQRATDKFPSIEI